MAESVVSTEAQPLRSPSAFQLRLLAVVSTLGKLAARHKKQPVSGITSLPFAIVLAASSFFEKLEFVVAQIVSPELGMAYLGTQGDVWDAQKDMTAAMFGALLCMGLLALTKKAEPQSVAPLRAG